MRNPGFGVMGPFLGGLIVISEFIIFKLETRKKLKGFNQKKINN